MVDFNEHDEVEIRIAMQRQEAERRLKIIRFFALADSFFEEFPAGTKESFSHKMSTDQLIALITDYMGECPPADVLGEALREREYKQVFEKEEYPVRLYWVFA